MEVVRRDDENRSYIVCSGWGEASEWYRNLRAQPHAEIEVGRRTMKVTATPLSQRQAQQEIRDYSKRHPKAFRWLAGILIDAKPDRGAEDFAELAKRAPMMALKIET